MNGSARPATSEKWTTRESRPISTTTDCVAWRANHTIGRSSPFRKKIPLFTLPKSVLETSPSRSATRGVSGSSSTLGWDAVDAAAFCARRDRRAGDEPVSDQQHADERCCCVRRSRVVLTPRCWCQVCGVASAQPGLDKTISASDGGKRARSPGRARNKPLKPLRAGMPGDSGVLVVTRVLSTTTSAHEAAGAAGIRHSPLPHFEGNVVNDSGALRREIVDAYPSRRPHGWWSRPVLGEVWRS
jgi:hypothetical protein